VARSTRRRGRSRAAERPGGQRAEGGEVDAQARALAQRGGTDRILLEMVAHLPEHVLPLRGHRARQLEHAVEVLWVAHQVGEVPHAPSHRQLVLQGFHVHSFARDQYASYRSHRQLAFEEHPWHREPGPHREKSRVRRGRSRPSTPSSTRPLAFWSRPDTTGRAPTASRRPRA
jgi:hypothetical protein